ncbi:Protein argonaute [Elasticomyces elasticus]|nr:Protein argonaute [Elasticomyces elasticus]
MPARQSSLGQPDKIVLNTFRVKKMPSISAICSESPSSGEKRSLMTTVRQINTVQKELGKGWIYDGNKQAWSMTGRFAVESNMSGNLGGK